MPLLEDAPVSIVGGATKTFGPYAIPDNLHMLHIRLARATKANPAIFANPATRATVLAEENIDSAWRRFGKYPFDGGLIEPRVDGRPVHFSGFGGRLDALCAICGKPYPVGDAAYEYDPVNGKFGALSHSSIELLPGKTLADANVEATGTRVGAKNSVEEFKHSIIRNDEKIFLRTPHTPRQLVPGNRLFRVNVSVEGPDLVSRLTVEVA